MQELYNLALLTPSVLPASIRCWQAPEGLSRILAPTLHLVGVAARMQLTAALAPALAALRREGGVRLPRQIATSPEL